MSKIALGMIVKGSGNEPEMLDKALSSVENHVDAIFITITGNKEETKAILPVCKKHNAKISFAPDDVWHVVDKKMIKWLKDFLGNEPHCKVGDRIFRFDAARNYNMSNIPKDYDWFMWIDVDDIVDGADKLHEIADFADKKGLEAVYFNYWYHVDIRNDEIVNVIIEHLRERLIKNNGVYKWIAPIHETLIEQRPTQKADDPRCKVIHLSGMNRMLKAIERNLNNLELSVYETKGEDPRPVYYLAKAYFDLKTDDYDNRAIPLLYQYLIGEHKSGWPEERSQAWEYLAEIHRRKGEHNNSIKACMNALIEFPEFQTPYINLAVSYMLKKEWDRALFWIRLSTTFPSRKTTLIKNPKDMQMRTLQVIYNCCLHMSKVDEAWAAAQKLKEIDPDNEDVDGSYKFIGNLRKQRDLTKMYVQLSEYLRKTGQGAKIKPLLSAAPDLIVNTPFIQDLYKKNMPPKIWGDKEVALYCGPGFTHWSPKRLTDPQGSFVGGSEEAVIKLSAELQKLGYQVTVYADPGDEEGLHDGVNWLPFYKFNEKDRFNILVFWRVVNHVDKDFNAKQIYIWCHDIQNNLEWTEERIKKVTKAFFLSKWHRENVPNLPDDKVIISTNAI